MVYSAQNQDWKDILHPIPSLWVFPSCVEITMYAISSAVLERQEERTKTSYLLNINLITTQLGIAANRRVFNSTSRIVRTTSGCALRRHDRIRLSIFSQVLSVKSNTKLSQFLIDHWRSTVTLRMWICINRWYRPYSAVGESLSTVDINRDRSTGLINQWIGIDN